MARLLRVLRMFRMVRMARLLKVFKELWLIAKGMIDSVKTIFWAALLLLMLLYGLLPADRHRARG